jgi:hypothetical protein
MENSLMFPGFLGSQTSPSSACTSVILFYDVSILERRFHGISFFETPFEKMLFLGSRFDRIRGEENRF